MRKLNKVRELKDQKRRVEIKKDICGNQIERNERKQGGNKWANIKLGIKIKVQNVVETNKIKMKVAKI